MRMTDPSKNMDRLIKAGTLTGLCVSLYLIYYYLMPACGALLSYIGPVFAPFILAAVIAVLIEPVVNLLSKRLRMPRGWSVLLVLLTFIIGISGILVLITSRLIVELQGLSKNIPNISQIFNTLITEAQYFYYNINLRPEVLDQIQQAASSIAGAITDFISLAINGMVSFLTSLPSGFMIFIITIVATFFFSRDKEKLEQFCIGLFPETWRGRAFSVYTDLSRALVGYFRAQATLISITTVISLIGLSILGAPYAFTMGLLSGFFDVLPIFGPGMVFVPWIIWTLIGGSYKLAASLACLYVIIIVQRQIMEPKLVAENIGLHPLATLAALFIGIKVLGVWGIILGPAILVTGKAIKKVL
ncbi:sporulation integral membrane protein YtvI [Candidatus Formimonas warabiya]|uniref:Sporulation integral membrane protein YtvI n=1 Tax=Formimonas warabiya TaxID=1761012 RepID=A0A3G1KQ28_FORW1|nr:sporulation integral membrane protein YtvI [Candidatus Formimonas warabiya]ATW24536.1 sporulation integral membrane protein YtvI [Candidatus Formimonas warabiya]